MSLADTIALGALILGIITAVCAVVYWLVGISYKVTRFIFELKGDLIEIKRVTYDNQSIVQGLVKRVKYLTTVMAHEFPDHFKRQEDHETDS